MKRIVLFLLTLLLLNITYPEAISQCAMCKATVEKSESEAEAFEKRARGLNAGILYLMAIPYVLAGVIGYYWYKNSKKERDRKEEVKRIIRSKLSQVQGGKSL